MSRSSTIGVLTRRACQHWHFSFFIFSISGVVRMTWSEAKVLYLLGKVVRCPRCILTIFSKADTT